MRQARNLAPTTIRRPGNAGRTEGVAVWGRTSVVSRAGANGIEPRAPGRESEGAELRLLRRRWSESGEPRRGGKAWFFFGWWASANGFFGFQLLTAVGSSPYLSSRTADCWTAAASSGPGRPNVSYYLGQA